jgi:nucleotide-binding universal stress UspA family protein
MERGRTVLLRCLPITQHPDMQAAHSTLTRTPEPEPEPGSVTMRRQRSRIGTVMLATDLTSASDAATLQAIDLAASLEARLLVVNVMDLGEEQARPLGPLSHAPRVDQMRADRERPLLAVVDEARSHGVEAVFLLWTGEAARSIVAAAEAEKADLLIVGTRGLDRADRFLLGSVSDYVVYHSPCPVLVAR